MESDKNSKDANGEISSIKDIPESIFGKQFLLVYKDDRGKGRTKILILDGMDATMYYFTNPKTSKSEILPRNRLVRMEEHIPDSTPYKRHITEVVE